MLKPLQIFSVHLWPSSGAAIFSEMQCSLVVIMELNIQELPNRVQALVVS